MLVENIFATVPSCNKVNTYMYMPQLHLPVDLPLFSGIHADLLTIVLHKMIVSGIPIPICITPRLVFVLLILLRLLVFFSCNDVTSKGFFFFYGNIQHMLILFSLK